MAGYYRPIYFCLSLAIILYLTLTECCLCTVYKLIYHRSRDAQHCDRFAACVVCLHVIRNGEIFSRLFSQLRYSCITFL